MGHDGGVNAGELDLVGREYSLILHIDIGHNIERDSLIGVDSEGECMWVLSSKVGYIFTGEPFYFL